MCSVLLFKYIFTEIRYGQPADDGGSFVQFVIDILMMMMMMMTMMENASPDITFHSWVEKHYYGNRHDLTVFSAC